MALQNSGAISLNDIHVEAGGSSGTTASINDSDIRGLIGKASGATMSFSEWYGASASASFVGSATLTFLSLNDWSSSNRLNLTGAGVQNGDLVVIALSGRNATDSGGHDITGISGLTEAYVRSNYKSPQYGIYYGIWQSGDSNPYSGRTTTGIDYFAVVGAIFRNTNTSLLNSDYVLSFSGMPDPRGLEGVSGTKLIVATGHLDDDKLNMTAGSGYLLAGSTFHPGTYGCSTGIQYKITSASTTENPPEFGGGGSDTNVATTLRF